MQPWDYIASLASGAAQYADNTITGAAQSFSADHQEYLHDWLPMFQANLAALKNLKGQIPQQFESARAALESAGDQIQAELNQGVNVADTDAKAWLHETALLAAHLNAQQGAGIISTAQQGENVPGDALLQPLQDAASAAGQAVQTAVSNAFADVPWVWIGVGVMFVFILPAIIRDLEE